MEFIQVQLESELVTLDMIVFWGSITCFIVFVAGMVRRESAFSTSMKVLLFALIFALFTYPVVSRFHQLEILGSRIHLGYVWSALDKDIEKSDIERVTFDVGTRNRNCHINLNTFSGDRHRSVVLSRDVAVCKTKKAELERYLGI